MINPRESIRQPSRSKTKRMRHTGSCGGGGGCGAVGVMNGGCCWAAKIACFAASGSESHTAAYCVGISTCVGVVAGAGCCGTGGGGGGGAEGGVAIAGGGGGGGGGGVDVGGGGVIACAGGGGGGDPATAPGSVLLSPSVSGLTSLTSFCVPPFHWRSPIVM